MSNDAKYTVHVSASRDMRGRKRGYIASYGSFDGPLAETEAKAKAALCEAALAAIESAGMPYIVKGKRHVGIAWKERESWWTGYVDMDEPEQRPCSTTCYGDMPKDKVLDMLRFHIAQIEWDGTPEWERPEWLDGQARRDFEEYASLYLQEHGEKVSA